MVTLPMVLGQDVQTALRVTAPTIQVQGKAPGKLPKS